MAFSFMVVTDYFWQWYVKFGIALYQNYTYKFSRDYCLCASNTDQVTILCNNVHTMHHTTPHTSLCNYLRAILPFYQTAKTKCLQTFTCLHNRSGTAQTDTSDVIIRWKLRCTRRFIHSIGMCRMRWFLAVLRSFIHSYLLYTLSFHLFPPVSLPSSLTSSCHLFLGLHLSLVVSKFTYNTFLGILFPSILCTCPNQRNLFNLVVSITVGFLTLA